MECAALSSALGTRDSRSGCRCFVCPSVPAVYLMSCASFLCFPGLVYALNTDMYRPIYRDIGIDDVCDDLR